MEYYYLTVQVLYQVCGFVQMTGSGGRPPESVTSCRVLFWCQTEIALYGPNVDTGRGSGKLGHFRFTFHLTECNQNSFHPIIIQQLFYLCDVITVGVAVTETLTGQQVVRKRWLDVTK